MQFKTLKAIIAVKDFNQDHHDNQCSGCHVVNHQHFTLQSLTKSNLVQNRSILSSLLTKKKLEICLKKQYFYVVSLERLRALEI